MAVAQPGTGGRIAAPSTMTRAQILARGATGGRRGAAPPVAPPDPYDSIIAGLPQPMSSGQIGKAAQGQISPLLAALTGITNQERDAADSAITGYSNDAASKLAAIDYGAPYRQAETGQAAIDAALQQSLTGAGTSDAAALSSRLGVINDPSVAAAAGGLAGSGAAAGTTALASGSANLGNLLANAAGADSFGEKQPELTRLAAEQQIASAGAQAQQTIATDASNLEQQLPSIIANLTSESNTASNNIASARENQLSRQDALAAGGAKAAQTAQTNQIKVDTVNANNATRLQIAQMNAQGKVTSQQMAQARSDRSYALQFAKTYGYNPATGQVAAGFKKGPDGTYTKTGSGGPGGIKPPTSNEIAKDVQAWHDGTVKSAQVPQYDSNGKPILDSNGAQVYKSESGTAGILNYTQALKRLTASGVPPQQALQYLDSAWKRGEKGRSWLTNTEQAALKSDGMPAKAKIVNGHGVLNGFQVATLKRAGKLPAGQETSDGYYVIAQGY